MGLLDSITARPNPGGEWYDIEHWIDGSEWASDVTTVVGSLRPVDEDTWMLEFPFESGMIRLTRARWERAIPAASRPLQMIEIPTGLWSAPLQVSREEAIEAVDEPELRDLIRTFGEHLVTTEGES